MDSFGSSAASESDKARAIEQFKAELAMANAQQLIQKISDKCFLKCVTYPNPNGLDTRQQKCLSNCVDRFFEVWNIVSKTYQNRLQRDTVGMH